MANERKHSSGQKAITLLFDIMWVLLIWLVVDNLMRSGHLKLLGFEESSLVDFLAFSMLRADLVEQKGSNLKPVTLNWKTWSNRLRDAMFSIVRNEQQHWNKQDEKNVFGLLAQLPVDCWLNLEDVINWLQLQASGNVKHAAWQDLFVEYQNYALHHLNHSHQRIYLLPEFRAVIKQQAVSFPAPGWRGADKKARTHGFINAAGEIQLPPDCNHRVLHKLVEFCSIKSVEQMITLQLDQKALQRIATDKMALKKTRALLESLQSPLPQAVAYLFDKQQAQKPVATAASAAMVLVLNDASAIHKLHKTGFEFSQPFENKPEIVLLDASADAHAFLKSCSEDGILLETLIKPVEWISGTASIKAWMEINLNREDNWLEICYQKARSSKPKQLIARIEDDYHGLTYIQATRKTRQGYALLKSTVRLEPKHVLRLRELDTTEVKDMGLDTL